MAADRPLEAFVEQAVQGSEFDLEQFVAGQVAQIQADWDPREHPRGPDGEFIEDPLSVALDAIPLDSEAWVSKDQADIEEGEVMKIVKDPFGDTEERVARVQDVGMLETTVVDDDGNEITVGGPGALMGDNWENHGIYDPDLAREERIEELEREEPPKVDPEDLDDLPPVQMGDGWQEIPLDEPAHEQVNPGDAVNVMDNDSLAEKRATVDEATSDRVAVTTEDGDELSKDPDELEGDFDILHHWDPDEEPEPETDDQGLTPSQRQAVRETLEELPDIGRPDEPGDGNTPGDPGYFTSDLAQDANDEQATSLAATLNEQRFLGIGYDAEPLESEADLPEGFKQESELAIFDGPGTPTMDVLMDPEDFLHVSAQMRNEANGIDQDLWKADVDDNRLDSLVNVLEGGADPERGGIPMPVLQVNDTGDLMSFQEGRHRAWAALEAGYDRIPVRIGLDERGDGVAGAEAFVEASLADAGLLAFDPAEHPRGPDGKFIEVGAVIEELADAFDGDTDYGKVDDIVSEATGVDDVGLALMKSDEELKEVSETLVKAGQAGMTEDIDRITTHGSDEYGLYTYNDRTLSLNQGLDSDEQLADLDGDGDAVGDSVEWLVLHELGHSNHQNVLDGPEEEKETIEKSLTTTREGEWIGRSRLDLIEEQVSDYARTNPAELVAEMYAGMAMGQEFPDEVMEIYEEWNGPTNFDEYQGVNQ